MEAFLEGAYTFLDMLAGIILAWIDTSESGKCAPVCETGNVPNLSYELRAKRWADTIHRHDDRIFRERGSSFVHFDAEGLHGLRSSIQHCDSLPYEHFRVVVFREHSDQIRGKLIDLFRFLSTDVIPFALTPVLIMLSKDLQRLQRTGVVLNDVSNTIY